MDYLLNEAKRCYQCKKPKCQAHCPIHTPIPQIIKLFEEDKLHEAGEILFNNNPLSAICAIVCPHEDQCNGNCIHKLKGEPVHFFEIEKYISRRYLRELTITKPALNGQRVAVVGSGPAGITASILLAQKGYAVTIFEMRDKLGGMLAYGIPAFRLPRTLIEDLGHKLIQLGVTIKYNTLVGPVITLDKLLYDGYDAIFIGTGVWNPRTLEIKGETLGHALYAIDYLKNPTAYNLGERVCVIGAGDVAMDAARTAKYYGSPDVQVYYRRDYEDMTATHAERADAVHEGVRFNFFKSPVEITDEGVIFMTTQKVMQPDGTTQLEVLPETESLVRCDHVIIAVSQSPQNNIRGTSPDLQTKYGLLAVDTLGHTSKQGVFGCGDVVSGAKTVIDAVVAAKIVAGSIDTYCQTLKDKEQ